jgi:hypothetical protein
MLTCKKEPNDLPDDLLDPQNTVLVRFNSHNFTAPITLATNLTRHYKPSSEPWKLTFGQEPDDFPDRGLEPEVQHPVRLIQHEHSALRQRACALLHQILQPARCRHHNGRTPTDRRLLGALGDPPIHAYRLDAALFAGILKDLRNLSKQGDSS